MELVAEYLFVRYIGVREPLPFPKYLLPENRFYNDFWITKQGECVYPYQMRDGHLLRTIEMIHRQKPRLAEKYLICNADLHVLYGFYAYYKYKNMKNKKGRAVRIPSHIQDYCDLWTDYRLYMLLRHEAKLRELEVRPL